MVRADQFVPGVCIVCDQPAILKWFDSELGGVGDCCHVALVEADKNLMAMNFKRPIKQENWK
jgi:hypothetical protein